MIKRHTTYRVHCLGCRFSRDFGAARIMAELATDKHARKYEHAVELLETTRVYLIEPKKIQIPLGDDPPF